jgi:hypothetical protein
MNAWSERRHTDEAIDELISGPATATGLLELAPLVDELRDRYANRFAPAPNAELEQVFAWGLRAEEEDTRRAPFAAWLPTRARARSTWSGPRRVVVAVLAATLVLGGLAVAGAAPAVQDAIADAAKAFGLELPRSTPETPKRSPVPSGPSDASSGQSGVAPATGVTSAPAAGTPSSSSSTSATSLPSGAAPPSGGTDVDVPPITLPTADLPPVTVPDLPVDIPPVDLPPITLPPITLPPLPPIL